MYLNHTINGTDQEYNSISVPLGEGREEYDPKEYKKKIPKHLDIKKEFRNLALCL